MTTILNLRISQGRRKVSNTGPWGEGAVVMWWAQSAPPPPLIVGNKKNFIIIAEKTFFHLKTRKLKQQNTIA